MAKKEDYNAQVVAKIKELRQQNNIGQQALATALGLTVAAYSRIESGKTQLTINNLFTIAEALGTDISRLLPFTASNNAHNHHSLVMTNFNQGQIHIDINAKELLERFMGKK